MTKYEQRLQAKLEKLLRDEDARDVFWWTIYNVCGLNAATFAADDRSTAFGEGKRAAGRKLRSALFEANAELCLQMELEAAQRALNEIRSGEVDKQKGLRK